MALVTPSTFSYSSVVKVELARKLFASSLIEGNIRKLKLYIMSSRWTLESCDNLGINFGILDFLLGNAFVEQQTYVPETQSKTTFSVHVDAHRKNKFKLL